MPRGKSAISVHSDSSEMEMDGIAETELTKLQRQFRVMEAARQTDSIQVQGLIRKQRQELESLQAEQEELQRCLGPHGSVSRRQQDSETTQSLRALLEQRDQLDEDLEREKQCQAELEKEISAMKLGEVNPRDSQASQARRTQKAIRTLENKLDRALICFNEQMTKNSHLREELETLHVERVHFQQLHYRLDKELQEIRKEKGEMISLSTAAYEARAEAQSKMTMMREKAVKDLAQYNTEMKELERVIAHEKSLKEFMTTKCSERTGQDEGHEMGRKLLTELKQQRRRDSGVESVDALEEVFQKIQAVTGEDNLDLLVTKFIQGEDRNFALFNYVNEQNNEAETLKDQIHQIQGEMERFQVECLQQEQEHQALLRGIDEQRRGSEARAVGNETQASIVSRTMDQIKTGVSSVFGKMGCDPAVIEDALGSSAGISENNIMSYLGLVEQRTNELLTMQAFLVSKDIEKEYNPKDLARFLLGQSPEMPKQNITIQLPITREDYDTEGSPVTDEEERPLSQGELRQRIKKGILRKEGAVRQAGTRDTKASKSNHQAIRRPLEAE